MMKQIVGLLFLGLIIAAGWYYKYYQPEEVHVELAASYEGVAVPGMRAVKNNREYVITSVRLANEMETISEVQTALAMQGSPELVILDSKLPKPQHYEVNVNVRLRIIGVRVR
jgi:hypothetical protein